MIADARTHRWEPGSIQTAVTSPPYWGQRDYGFEGQIGIEPAWTEYVETLVGVFSNLRDGLADDGTLWLNIGDTYNTNAIIRGSAHQGGLGHDNDNIRLGWSEAAAIDRVRYAARQPGFKFKDLMGLPWRVVEALVADGWFLRCDVVWAKPYGSPENANDRPTRMHEFVFLLSKSKRYHYDKTACPEGHRSVWEIAPAKGTTEHAAVFPDELVRRCLLLTSRPGDLVADPFMGSGTVDRVAAEMGRRSVGIDGREWSADRPASMTAAQGAPLSPRKMTGGE